MSKEFEIARLIAIREAREVGYEALAYAWSRRIYPGFHVDPLIDAFTDEFNVDSQALSDVMKFLDDDWMGAKSLSFYDLESEFSDRWGGAVTRSNLIGIMRYIFLSGRFNDELWTRMTVNGSGPIESQGIAERFDPIFDSNPF